MSDFEKIKKIICGNKLCTVEHLKQFGEVLEKDALKSSVVNNLQKLLTAIFKYAFHEDSKYCKASIPSFVQLVNLIDLNKHFKDGLWWSEIKVTILKSIDVLTQLAMTGEETWPELWCALITLLGTDLRSELVILNKLLKVVEKAFKMNNEETRNAGFNCWCKLIDNFAINRQELNNKRRLNLLVIPLKAGNHNSARLCSVKMKTWRHLLSKLDQHNEMTVQVLIPHFLEFMFQGVGNLPPACKTVSLDCAKVFLQLIESPLVFGVVPELFIKYTFTCIEYAHEDLKLSLSIWEGLLDNMKHSQWKENLVSELMIHLSNASSYETFGKSKTFAHMIHLLYSGTNAMPSEMVVTDCKAFISLVLEPHVLVHFSESWCNDLFDIILKTDHILVPQNLIGDIVKQLSALSSSQMFRDDQLKFLRAIWVAVTNIFSKLLVDAFNFRKIGTAKTDMHNAYVILIFGAAELSSMWNKFQMRSWKSLYMECVKYFSLLPDVDSDKFVIDLVELLCQEIHNTKIPLHVAVDIICLLLEFSLAKDVSSVLPLMMEVAESGIKSLQNVLSGMSALLNHYLKSITLISRSDPALTNSILPVFDKMLKLLEASPVVNSEKIRNMVLKAQHQLSGVKQSRNIDKSESSSNGQPQPASSPTMTSFLHRLAKAKETKAKLTSPTSSQSSDMSSSPGHTPNSKKTTPSLADLKNEDFVFVPPKSRKLFLTDHQKESLIARKHDIPALYQDLSQDSSQSALESIVTSVQTVEDDVDKIHILRSPKKQNNSIELGLKVLTPKKSSDTNLLTETKMMSNKENDCVNNNTKSPFASVGKQEKIVGIRENISSVNSISKEEGEEDNKMNNDSIQGTEENKKNPKINLSNKKLKANKNLTNSINDRTMNVSETNVLNVKVLISSPQKVENKSSISIESIKDSEKGESLKKNGINNKIVVSETEKEHLKTGANISIKVSPPKRPLRRNKLIISVTKSSKKDKRIKTKKNVNDKLNTTPPTNAKESSTNSITPSTSPRRLRKRKSGVTPLLGGVEFIRKKSSPSILNTPNSSKVNKKPEDNASSNDVYNHNDDSKNKNETQTFISLSLKGGEDSSSDKNKTLQVNVEDSLPSEDKNQKQANVQEVLTTVNKSDVFCPLNVIIQEKVQTVNVTKADDIMLCSPVKVVLSRMVNENIKHSTVLNHCVRQIMHETDSKTKDKLYLQSPAKDKQKIENAQVAPKKDEMEKIPVQPINSMLDEQQSPPLPNSSEDCTIIFDANEKRSFKSDITIVSEKTVLEEQHPTKDSASFRKLRSMKSNKKLADSNQKPCETEEKCSDSEMLLSNKDILTIQESLPLKPQVVESDKKGVGVYFDCVTKESINTNNNTIREDHVTPDEKSHLCAKTTVEFNEELKVDATELEILERDDATSIKNQNGSLSQCVTECSKQNNKYVQVIQSTKVHSLKKNDNCEVLINGGEEISNSYYSKSLPQENANIEKDCSTSNKNTDISVILKKLEETGNNTENSLEICKQMTSGSTPVKSGQKHLKQTQLPFTPIPKTVVPNVDKSDMLSNNENSDFQNNDHKTNNNLSKQEKVPFIMIEKLNNSDLTNNHISPIKKLNSSRHGHDEKSLVEGELNDNEALNIYHLDRSSLTIDVTKCRRQEAPRTPEKVMPTKGSHSNIIEIDPSDESVAESPIKTAESEDIIASSQENDLTSRSCILVDRATSSGSNSPIMLSNKSPKKNEGVSFSQISNNCDRVLRSSPLKIETPRLSGTPLKKSVCRRLDIEIDNDPLEIVSTTDSEDRKLCRLRPSSPLIIDFEGKNKVTSQLVNDDYSEELLDDIQLLKEDKADQNKHSEIVADKSPSNLKQDSCSKNIEDSQPSTSIANTSPSSHKCLKRIMTEPNSCGVESPKRTMVSLRLDAGSPKSPSSRTNQMMELAMQDKEKTISSPANSMKKRRVQPLRLGPLLKTPQNLSSSVTNRTHNGPSEEWVRRTYSPSASPNSSILKRRGDPLPISPDSSPPSMKKKRVSFLDPPVSESLLFSKLVPGKGQIQRPEPKQEMESEEISSQGSLQLAVPLTTSNNQSKIFSPLKLCPNPLTDVLERIVSLQWACDLHGQLERLGVTTVGQLSSLTETTIERLPFIPPKTERLRKILQNYYNEMNEKPDSAKPESLALNTGESAVLTDETEEPIASPEQLEEEIQITDNVESAESISLLAEQIKNNIDLHPSLINELGNKLDVDIIICMLNCAVTKLKTQNDKR